MKMPSLSPRWLYCLYSFDYPLRCKVGISKNVEQRRACIAAELSRATGNNVTVRVAMMAPFFFAETWEQKIHRWLKFCRTESMPRHSGQTEWFWTWHLNFIGGAVAGCAMWWQGQPVEAAYVVCCALLPVPVVHAAIVFAVFLAELAAIVGAFYLIWICLPLS
jgi:hypothetical protein